MFGYVNIYKDELKIKDYYIYRGYYCGLCKKIGEIFSHDLRLTLNYEFTFLALLLSSLNGEISLSRERCAVHPIHKRAVIRDDEAVEYAAYMSVIVTYFKLADDVRDERGLKNLFAFLFFKRHMKKAKAKYPEEFEYIKNCLSRLDSLEKQNSKDIDIAADCFAGILEKLFVPSFIETDEISKKALANLGYNIGRFVYIIDAYDDILKDIKNKSYNPVLNFYGYGGEPLKEFLDKNAKNIELSLDLTLDSAAKAFELISFKKNRDILYNVIYLGLRNKTEVVRSKLNESI